MGEAKRMADEKGAWEDIVDIGGASMGKICRGMGQFGGVGD